MYYKCTQEFPLNHSLSFVMYVMIYTHITHKPCNHNYTVCMIISTAYYLLNIVCAICYISSLIYFFSTHQCQQRNLTITNITNTTVAVTWNGQDSNMYHVSYWEVNDGSDVGTYVSFLFIAHGIDYTN